ncbi:MAG: hypothetical protein PX638_10310, partial [Microcystis sp. M53599_WE4]|nr:hypothetical protein [Microcystis sp. M53599_WE4]
GSWSLARHYLTATGDRLRGQRCCRGFHLTSQRFLRCCVQGNFWQIGHGVSWTEQLIDNSQLYSY